MKRLLLPAVLAALMIAEVHAESFTISDIRVNGLQRVSAGSLFGALPLNVGDQVDERRLGEATRSLFKTGFFQDIQLGREGDVLLAISTSGTSSNITEALKAARNLNMITMGLTGKGGGDMPPLCDYLLDVPDDSTALIQEIHITVGHLLCRLVDYYLFENVPALQPHLKARPEQP